MTLKEILAIILALAAVFVIGQLWFHLVESVLARVRQMFTRRGKPPAWHPLPSEEQADKSDG